MRAISSGRIITVISMLTCLATVAAVGCTVRSKRPDGPYRAAQELADALSDLAVACTRQNQRPDAGQIVITAEITPAEVAPRIAGEGSTPGTETIVACVRERAGRLKNPSTVPAPLARIRVPLPLVTSGVSYAFAQPAPSSDAGAPDGG